MSAGATTNGLGGGGGGTGVKTVAKAAPSAASTASGIERLRELEALFLGGPIGAHEAKCFSMETLLDILLVLFSECCNSSLRKEKTVTDFIDLGKPEPGNTLNALKPELYVLKDPFYRNSFVDLFFPEISTFFSPEKLPFSETRGKSRQIPPIEQR